MEDTRQVRGRARGRARPLEQQILRSRNTTSSIVQRSVGASCVRPVNELSLRRQIDRTTEEAKLCDKAQNIKQNAVVPDGLKNDTSGIYINVEVNYITTNFHSRLYQYRVDYVPTVDRTQVRKKILAQVYRDNLTGYISDGTTLFTSTHIPPDLLTTLTNSKDDSGGAQTFKITLRLVDTEQCDYHLSYMFSNIVRKCLKLLKVQEVRRNSCDALVAVKIPNYRIQVCPDYFTSNRQEQSQIQMGYEISQKFMRKENILFILKQCIRQDAVNYKFSFEKLIVGCIVLTDYNNRTYRIDGIEWDKTIISTFTKSDGTSVSYKDFYKQKYHINISIISQPLLVSRAKAVELRAGMPELKYLVPELCRITGLNDNERLNTPMRQALTPGERIRRLKSYQDRMQTYTTERDGVCKRAYASNGMVLLQVVHTWVVMCPMHLKGDIIQFIQNLQEFAACMAMHLPQPAIQGIDDDRPATYLDGLDYVIERFNPKLILCIVNNNKADRYNAIKKKCCVDRGVASHILSRKNICNKAIISLATQLYCKLGGVPWTVSIPVSHVMVVGLHVSRDTVDKSKSYGVMVSSFDDHVSRYFNIVSTHTNGEELSNNFSLNIAKCVEKYQQENNLRLPDHIIIYRDGIRDCQESEVRGIRRTLHVLYHREGKALKLAFIVTMKRMSAKILLKLGNLPKRYNFVILSDIAEQETVSPANCFVIYDTLGVPPEHVQTITLKLTNMYYIRTGATRVPAPCRYAHKLAYLVSHSLHRAPNARLSKTLHFL